MSQAEREFVAASFQMETGLGIRMISKIGFNNYMIEAADGNTYHFR